MPKKKINPWTYLEPVYFVVYFILTIIAGIIFYPYILWCSFTSRPHHEESGYDK
mgnify:FL=1